MDPYQRHQPPYSPQGNYAPQGQPPPQPHYGLPQPGWQGPSPRKKGKLGWILGGIALAVTLLSVLGIMGWSALSQGINGGGGNQAEKANEMMARADSVPEDDWVEVFRNDPKVDPGCLSIDTSCLRLSARWSVDHEVSLDEAASRFGMDSTSNGSGSGPYTGCVSAESGGSSRESLCIEESSGGSGSYEVTIQMQRD
ncbi:hypothetical protein J2790_002664 [Paenarthrobacter nicotinovorans]|uniref:hypothetical protein n=1 Tax=Micrococcaceae TaxID=1268 RepID=UPI00087662F2|nr:MULTISPECIES: hypothetical protein [Micrococcaceae]MDR6437515.1 hypothetical protein [Paenarthrobacter nicotinovorans]SCZ60592.1 hypothetical protein SAMN02799638_02950 [Arthrobacter sp. UNCCL28]